MEYGKVTLFSNSIIQKLNDNLYIKREDLIPISFGGNKARKAINFYYEIDEKKYDSVVTYGSSSSNHCRIISNMAASRNLPCYIISPQEASEETFNKKMMELFGAKIITVPVNEVHDTIENIINELRSDGKNPYFISGGGHGNLGTQAYVDCYQEIKEYEKVNNTYFDYIFFASGTGTTQAGLVCGQYINKDDRKIIGISIARKNPRGRDVILQSIYDYLNDRKINYHKEDIEAITLFDDSYISEGYGTNNEIIMNTIKEVLIKYGIPLDSTYTGKAFTGMNDYLKKNNAINKKVLFIHTGGTPLFFNDLEGMK